MAKYKYVIYGVKHNEKLVYIGKSAYGLCKRKSKHKYEAYTKEYKDIFHQFIREVGFDNLYWFVIENCKTQEEIDIKEKQYIKKLKPLYNTQEKPFYCYKVDGTYIGEFSNIYNTSKTLNIDARKISNSIKNKSKIKEGYIFLNNRDNLQEDFYNILHPSIYKKIGWENVKNIYYDYLYICSNKSKLSIKYNITRKDIDNVIKFFENENYNFKEVV